MVNKWLRLCLTCLPLLLFSCGEKQNEGRQAGLDQRMREANAKAANYLAGLQRPDGSISDPANPLFQTWETIEALLALRACPPQGVRFDEGKAMAFLRANENAEGLICHNLKCREGYCLETTAEYFELLSQEECKARIGVIAKMQLETGQWRIGNPDVRERTDFPSVTAFVLHSFSLAGAEPGDMDAAVNWLLSEQTPEGDWGAAWEYYGCPAYALWAAMRELSYLPEGKMREARTKAVNYILLTQRKDGSWFYQLEGHAKTVSPELQTGLMLSALLHAAGPEGKAAVDRAIEYLLSRQLPDGSWDGGLFPIVSANYSKNEDVFATARILIAFNQYLTMPRP